MWNLLPAVAIALTATPDDSWFETRKLGNGIEVTVVEVASATREAVFSFLPSGLIHDDPGQAQFSHLLEHMLIRSSDPIGLSSDGIQVNGETTSLTVRFDSSSTPDRWKEAAAKHVAWWTAREFDPAVLEREKAMIASEEQGTVPSGYTGKWAEAAWAQIVRGGREHAGLHGDVQAATPEQLSAAVNRWVAGVPVRVVFSGPVPKKDVFAWAEKEIGELEWKRPADATETALAELPTGELTGTWDLDAQHYLEWYRLPNQTPVARAAMGVIAQLMQQHLFQNKTHPQRFATVTPGWHTPEGSFVAISLNIEDQSEIDQLRTQVDSAVEALIEDRAGIPLDQFCAMAVQEFLAPPPFEMMKRNMMSNPRMAAMADMAEAQMVLTMISREWSAGLRWKELGAATQKLESRYLREFTRQLFAADNRSSLFITRREDQ